MPAAKQLREEEGAELVQCVYRVAELPVVAAVFDGVRGVYDKVKHAPVPLVGRTFEAAEATVKYAAAQAYPIALKFEGPIEYIDSLACKGLDVIEDNVPIVKRTPDEIFTGAKTILAQTAQAPFNAVTHVKAYGMAKVEAATDYGRDKVIQAAKTTYGQRALQSMDAALTAVDAYVDKYMPATEPEQDQVLDESVTASVGSLFPAMEGFDNEENWDPALAPIAHAAALTNKIRHRIYKLTLSKAHAAQKRCADALDQVPMDPAGFVDYVRNQLTCGSQAIAEKTKAIWDETASITPGRAAQAVTSGVNVIEARTTLAARKLLQYLKWNYDAEQESSKKPL